MSRLEMMLNALGLQGGTVHQLNKVIGEDIQAMSDIEWNYFYSLVLSHLSLKQAYRQAMIKGDV